MYDIIYDIILKIIYDASVPVQLLIFFRHTQQMLSIAGMTMTAKWISTRCVILPIKVLCQTWTWKKMLRFLQHF